MVKGTCPYFLLRRFDVLIDAEKVIGIVLGFDLR